MKKILFLIHDLGQGGAEKVLVNLVNNMDHSKFDITVMALFGGGVNEQFLSPEVNYRACFQRMPRGNSHFMKLLSPRQLHRWLIKERYDVEISYLEGPSARIISGCPDPETKLVSWIHIEQKSKKRAARSFRSYGESLACYRRFDKTICVARTVKEDFLGLYPLTRPVEVLYNTNESGKILRQGKEPCPEMERVSAQYKLVGVGKLEKNKGFDRLLRITKQLREEGRDLHLYLLGKGPLKKDFEDWIRQNGMEDHVTLLGYQTNPYQFISKCDLFVCASHAEGFSTAATEALILGVPVCTVEVSGMKEMLGAHNEYGVVTENQEDALCEGIRDLLTVPGRLEHYQKQASRRGRDFSTEETVRAVEEMLTNL